MINIVKKELGFDVGLKKDYMLVVYQTILN